MQNWAMQLPTWTGARVAWARWRIGSNLRISTRRLASIVLCVSAFAFFPPVGRNRQSLPLTDLNSEPAHQTQTQPASPSAADQQRPPEYTISVESNRVVRTPDPLTALCKLHMPRGNIEKSSSMRWKAVWRQKSRLDASREGQKQLHDADPAEVH